MKNILKNKKAIIIAVAVIVIVCVIAAVCIFAKPADKKAVFIDTEQHTGEKILEHFDIGSSAEEMLADLKSFDFYHEPDFDNPKYTVKEKENPEDSTKQIEYYENDKLKYIDYVGYGEDMFDFFTRTEGGKDIKVTYTDDGGKRSSVSITDEICTISCNAPNKNSPFGAESIDISYICKKENDLSESITLTTEGSKYYIASAQYYSGDDFIRYSAYFEDEKCDRLIDDSYTLISKNSDEINLKNIKSVVNNKEKLCVQTVFGNNKFSYTGNSDAKKWYMTADLYVVFDSKSKAQKFADSLNSDKIQASNDVSTKENIWYAVIEDVTFPVSNKAEFDKKKLYEIITEETDDPNFRELKFDKNFALKGVEYSDLLSRY